jgi:hypothetical protein
MADTHRHNAQVHRHEYTHVTQDLRHGQQWAHMDTSHDTSTTTPPSAMPPGRAAPPGAAHRPHHRRVRGRGAVAQASPCTGGAGLLAPAPQGLGSRRAETTQSDYGRHLGSVRMIVLFVPHAAG